MRMKQLREMKIIEFLLINKNIGMTFEQIKHSSESIRKIHFKTLHRELGELVDKELLIFQDGLYKVNTQKYPTNNHRKNSEWNELLRCAIESGEIEGYRKIREYMQPGDQNVCFGDEELERFKTTIIENVKIFNESKIKLAALRKSIIEQKDLQIKYKGKIMQIHPLCIVTSRDGVRNYLFGIRKRKLETPLALSDVQILREMDADFIGEEKNHYLEMIKRSWDIDIHEPIYVKILLRKEYDRNHIIEKQLTDYFGYPLSQDENISVYEGSLIGINDFKKWIRENMLACYIMEPEHIRRELMDALKVKISRYETDG